MNKTLIFRVSNDWTSLALHCEWTPELRALIKKRHEAVKALAEGQDSFNCATFFWYGLDVTQDHSDLDCLDEHGNNDEVVEVPDNGEPMLVDAELPEMVSERCDLMLMCVTEDNVYFQFSLKHTTEFLEGGYIDLDDEEFFPKEG